MATSTQLGQYLGYKKTEVGAKKTPAIEVAYVRLDGGDDVKGKETNARYLVGTLDEASKAVLTALKKGDNFVIVKEKVGEYWNLKEFKEASTYVAQAPKPPYNKGKSSYPTSEEKKEKDIGMRAGTARNQALTWLTHNKKSFQLDEVNEIAKQAILHHIDLEEWIKDKMPVNGQTAVDTTQQQAAATEDDDSVPF